MKWNVSYRSLLAVLAMSLPSLLLAQDIVVNKQGAGDELVLRNDRAYTHFEDNNVDFNTVGFAPFLLAPYDGQPHSETSGIYGDDDVMTLWSPGDGATAASSPPSALVYFLDEDAWNDNDGDPYNNGALEAYLNTSGVWTVSDRLRKTNFAPLGGALDRVLALNGYTFEFVMSDQEVAKGQVAERRAGLVAQELALVLPEAVASNADGEMWVNYSLVVPLLIEAIKEQQVLIDELRAKQGAIERRSPWSL